MRSSNGRGAFIGTMSDCCSPSKTREATLTDLSMFAGEFDVVDLRVVLLNDLFPIYVEKLNIQSLITARVESA